MTTPAHIEEFRDEIRRRWIEAAMANGITSWEMAAAMYQSAHTMGHGRGVGEVLGLVKDHGVQDAIDILAMLTSAEMAMLGLDT